MALAEVGNASQGSGIAFLVSAGIVYEIIAANCSSPQTTELNAATRAPTLMKWVNIGTAEGLLFVIIAACLEGDTTAPVLLGGGMAAVITYAEYIYAKRCGLANGGTPTEKHSAQTYGNYTTPGFAEAHGSGLRQPWAA